MTLRLRQAVSAKWMSHSKISTRSSDARSLNGGVNNESRCAMGSAGSPFMFVLITLHSPSKSIRALIGVRGDPGTRTYSDFPGFPGPTVLQPVMRSLHTSK